MIVDIGMCEVRGGSSDNGGAATQETQRLHHRRRLADQRDTKQNAGFPGWFDRQGPDWPNNGISNREPAEPRRRAMAQQPATVALVSEKSVFLRSYERSDGGSAAVDLRGRAAATPTYIFIIEP
ncbi:MAG: hypothetical protein ACMG5Z_08810 [Luteimonas sp.]